VGKVFIKSVWAAWLSGLAGSVDQVLLKS